MKFPKVLKLKSGAHDRVPFDLSSRTITTGEFYQFCPVKMIECVPGDKIDIDMTVFTRTAPLSVPSFDRAVVQTRAFFVPSRLCYPYFNEFITGEKVVADNVTINPNIPVLDSTDLVNFFATGVVASRRLSDEVEASAVYDFKTVTGTGSSTVVHFYQLNQFGRRILKILQGLGYRWNWISRQEEETYQENLSVQFSSLPLFAFFRVYLDWFVPSQLQAAHPINSIFRKWLSVNTTNTVTFYDLQTLFESVCPAYDEDYFTAAWLNPNEVGGDTARIVPPQMADYHASGTAGYSQANLTEVTDYATQLNRNNSTGSGIFRLSQYALNLLEGMANYVTRNNYAGSRAVEQILARFGVRVPDTRMNRCEFIGADDTDIQFAEVTATADSGNYKVGQFAGKGVAYGSNGKFSVECKEYGFVVVVSTIVPKISYVQGFDRSVIHKSRFDFFTPEFDCVGPQAIASGELYCEAIDDQWCNWQDLTGGNGKPMDIFGYCPRYAEYKVSHDLLLGDFNIPHLNDNKALNAYHFSRMYYPSANTPARAQGQFLFADGQQYNRIFNVIDNSLADHFYMWYNFDIKALRPMRSISDSIPLDGDGEKVAQQPNGVHMS